MPPHNPNDEPDGDADSVSASSAEARDEANERTDDWTTLLSEAKSNKTANDAEDASELNDQGMFLASNDAKVSDAASSKDSEHSQSLRSKLVLSLALMLSVVVGIDEIVRQQVIAPEFVNLERVAALKDTNRVLSAINTEVDYLAETASQDVIRLQNARSDQSAGDDSDDANLELRGLQGRIHWSAIVDDSGNWKWIKRISGLTGDSPMPDDFSIVEPQFPGITEIVTKDESHDQRKTQGMISGTDGDLYLFAALNLSRERDALSPPDGPVEFYVVGRHFGDEVVQDLERRTSVRFSIHPIGKNESVSRRAEITEKSSSTLHVASPLVSPSGKTLARLNVELPRDVTIRSNRTTAFARYLSLCGACASLLLLLLLLQRIVIGRLVAIREQTERIAQTGIIAEQSNALDLNVSGDDEIGQLAQSFERMRNRLGDAQRRLSDASHAAGMSLVADTVIHNVGNVLTNVNSLIETANRRVETLRIEPLEKLAQRLRADDVDEDLQKATPDYLQRLSQTLEDDKDDLAALLHTLNDNIQHIHQVIRDQRRHANQPVEWVQVSLKDVLDEAVRCSQARLSQDNVRVELVCDLDARVWTDRSLLQQILINIIGNAGNATRDITSRQPTLLIDLIRTKSTIHIRFRDNGCGMNESTLSRVFDAHFTTRASGSGLGLHFCAIALKRIGGAIRAESDGPDKGATFVVEVPISKPSADKAGGSSNAMASEKISAVENFDSQDRE